jgi:hypothetical protein
MVKAIADIQKKRGRPSVGSIGVMVKLPPEDLEALDLWIAANAPGESRPEGLRRILRLLAMRIPAAANRPASQEGDDWQSSFDHPDGVERP